MTAHRQINIAILIDADNSPASMIDEVLTELARYGTINIRRAYGNWKSPHLGGWEKVLLENAIQPVQQFAYSRGKNASDMAMTIDAMDIIHSHPVQAISLVSSDADFTPLAMRIKAAGITVYGFGEKKTPAPFVSACSTFIYLENLAPPPEPVEDLAPAKTVAGAEVPREPAPMTRPARRSGKELKGDSGLIKLLRDAVAASADEDGWASLSKIGQYITQRSSFDPRNYGYAKLRDMLAEIDLFVIEARNQHPFVRDKRSPRA